MSYLSIKDGQLQVPNQLTVPFIQGDGIGPEIWQASKKVIDTAIYKAYHGQKTIQWQEIYAGQTAFEKFGTYPPDETSATIQEAKLALKGPLMTPIGEGFRSLNVTLRQTLDLFACVRPVRYFSGVPSPLKHPEKTDMVIFRENTEDVYAGIEFLAGQAETTQLIEVLKEQFGVQKIRFPQTSSIGIKPVSKEGSQRLIAAAIDYALANKRKSVTLVHKGNIMKFTEGHFKKWGYDLAEEKYTDVCFTMQTFEKIAKKEGKEAAQKALNDAQKAGKLIIKDVIADNFLQQILLYP